MRRLLQDLQRVCPYLGGVAAGRDLVGGEKRRGFAADQVVEHGHVDSLIIDGVHVGEAMVETGGGLGQVVASRGARCMSMR